MAEEYDLLVLNGVVVTDAVIGEFDIAIKDEKIAEVVPRGGLSGISSKRTIDAQGGYVMVSWKHMCMEIANSTHSLVGLIPMSMSM
jgi:hypothetical protein